MFLPTIFCGKLLSSYIHELVAISAHGSDVYMAFSNAVARTSEPTLFTV